MGTVKEHPVNGKAQFSFGVITYFSILFFRMSPDQLKSQALGLSLAIATAIGCIAYERLTKNFSYATVALLTSLSYFPFCLIALMSGSNIKQDLPNLSAHWATIVVFLLSGITSMLWYTITRKQNIMVGSLYEIKYIVIMAILYILFGTSKLTINTSIGIILAMASVYFISKK